MALRPVPMRKVGLLGLREDEERTLTVLHDLRIAQVEPLSPEALAELGPERGSETLRRIGDETLRFRGLLSALPPTRETAPRRFDSVDAILEAAKTVPVDDEVGALERENDRLQTEEKSIDDTLRLLGTMSFYTDRLYYLSSPSYLAFLGEAEPEAFEKLKSTLPPEVDAQFVLGPRGDPQRFLLVCRSTGGEALTTTAQSEGIRLTTVPVLSGTVGEETGRLEARRAEIRVRRAEIRARLAAIARDWYPTVAAIDEALEIENRKAEILTKLGATRSAFALEAWVPVRDIPKLRSVVEAATEGRVAFYTVATKEEPPTMMSNPRGVRRFEFFVRFYSLPQADEWDPTLVFSIVFPIFFGFMLGDWGYGLVILLISIWMIRGFPGAQHLPRVGRNFVKRIMGPKGMQQLAWALLPGCAIAIGLGLYFDEFFGYPLLHALVHYTSPVVLNSPVHSSVGTLLLIAGYIGLGMVTLGFAFGALKEYFHHHPRGTVAKVGGILFAWGIAFFGLAVIHHATAIATDPLVVLWYAFLGAGLAMLLGGEGLQNGMMGFIEIVSHILSFTRLVGILLASVILAAVIYQIADHLHSSIGGLAGLLLAAIIIVGGQSFNVILGVFEPGIQGARLIFVEYFSKFYSGNGRPFRPFGQPRTHTLPSIGADGAILQAPKG
jgi:V/A-type H+/Na+-transporting ATPase subunit I